MMRCIQLILLLMMTLCFVGCTSPRNLEAQVPVAQADSSTDSQYKALLGYWVGTWGGETAALHGNHIDNVMLVTSVADGRVLLINSLGGNKKYNIAATYKNIDASLVDDNAQLGFTWESKGRYQFVLSDDGQMLLGHYRVGNRENRVALHKRKVTDITHSKNVSVPPPLLQNGPLSQFNRFLMSISLRDFSINAATYFVLSGLVFFIFWHRFGGQYLSRLRIRDTKVKLRQIIREIAYSVIATLLYGCAGAFVLYAVYADWTYMYFQIADYGWWYWIASLVVVFILHDAYFYWTHRLMHHRKLFRYFHKVHHLSHQPTAWTSYAFSPLESLVQVAFVPIICVSLPIHYSVIFIFIFFSLLRNIIGHNGVEVFPQRTLTHPVWQWSTTVTHHDMHHQYSNCNYGLYFTWWDRWMKTTHREYDQHFARAHKKATVGCND